MCMVLYNLSFAACIIIIMHHNTYTLLHTLYFPETGTLGSAKENLKGSLAVTSVLQTPVVNLPMQLAILTFLLS
jgi:hypothetical protein